MLPKRKTQSNIQHDCCSLLRVDQSSRSILPLARRGRPYLPSRSHRFLCKNCTNIKRRQLNDILQQQQQQHEYKHNDERTSPNIFETMIDVNKPSEEETRHQMIEHDIPHEIEFSLINDYEKNHLNNSEYDTAEMLIWKINTSNNNHHHHSSHTIDMSYDTGSLTNNEKKILLQEAIQKLQIVLSNRSTSTGTIPDSDLDKIEFTYRALQTTVNILSSSIHSL